MNLVTKDDCKLKVRYLQPEDTLKKVVYYNDRSASGRRPYIVEIHCSRPCWPNEDSRCADTHIWVIGRATTQRNGEQRAIKILKMVGAIRDKLVKASVKLKVS